MPVESVKNNPNAVIKRSNNQVAKQQSFTGSFNPVVTLMDAIDRGGFAASFIAQDGIGMVAPRIYEGLNRNRKRDENGKKTGPLNWEFARREGIREVLSGPSAFLIPMGMLSLIKKFSGTANNVYVSHIKALGANFAEYASQNSEQLKNIQEFKKGYYSKVFEDALTQSTDNNIPANELKERVEKYTNNLIQADDLRANKKKKEAKKLVEEITEDFMRLRKSYTAASNNELEVVMTNGDKKLHTNIRRLTQSLTDYTNDALHRTANYVKNNNTAGLKEYIDKFNTHRMGTRVVSNLGMWSAVVGFYALIPKLYNIGLKHDPGLKGLENFDDDKKEASNGNKEVSFQGNMFSKVGEAATKDGFLSKLLGKFEFNGAAMSTEAMLTLLFGFTLPTRYTNAKSDKERKEIIVRDISSFAAILFAAKALARGFSNMFAKASGLALNITPADHSKGIMHKLKNYFSPTSGIEVLTSEQIVSKYSNITDYKDGINGFFRFIEENGGNVKKVLNIDNVVRDNANLIVRKYANKTLKDATFEEIDRAFMNAKIAGSEQLEKIHTIFAAKDNKFINRAKTLNSAFGFASTLILVPAFMMWLARYCEKMTKKAVAKEQAQKQAELAKEQDLRNKPAAEQIQAANQVQDVIFTSKPTLQEFLHT